MAIPPNAAVLSADNMIRAVQLQYPMRLPSDVTSPYHKSYGVLLDQIA